MSSTTTRSCAVLNVWSNHLNPFIKTTIFFIPLCFCSLSSLCLPGPSLSSFFWKLQIIFGDTDEMSPLVWSLPNHSQTFLSPLIPTHIMSNVTTPKHVPQGNVITFLPVCLPDLIGDCFPFNLAYLALVQCLVHHSSSVSIEIILILKRYSGPPESLWVQGKCLPLSCPPLWMIIWFFRLIRSAVTVLQRRMKWDLMSPLFSPAFSRPREVLLSLLRHVKMFIHQFFLVKSILLSCLFILPVALSHKWLSLGTRPSLTVHPPKQMPLGSKQEQMDK